MGLGRKLYYEKMTGDEILVIPEKHNNNSTNTTKEQDFQVYSVLQVRNPDHVKVIQLEYGEKRYEFERSISRKVDLKTGEVLFQYPFYEPSAFEKVTTLEGENADLIFQNAMQDMAITNLQNENADLMFRLATLEMGGI